jgi:CSLREA domain-containing protein
MIARISSLLLLALLLLALTPNTTRAAASIVVNTTSDDDGTGATCSLREAIKAANNDANYGGCVASGAYGADTITFDSKVFSTPQTITLNSGMTHITSSMSINGPGTNLLTISGNSIHQPFYISNSTVTIRDLTVSNGSSQNGGNLWIEGGNVTLSHLVIRSGRAVYGGGINHFTGTLTVTDTYFYGNHAGDQGGGIFNDQYGSTLFLSSSTFAGNDAGSLGAGIMNYGTLIASNSTFSGNMSGNQGGGIHNYNGQATLVNVTLNGNTATTGGGIYKDSGTLRLLNSIVANSTGGDCAGASTVSHSLIQDGSCGASDLTNGNLTGDPKLSALADNGGLTQTMAVGIGSPAVDTGDNSLLTEAAVGADFNGDGDTNDTLTTDQRGASYARVENNTVDMGAFESVPPPSTLTVDTTSDSNLTGCTDLPNDCSLRGAINLANAYADTQTILFDATVFPTGQIITLDNPLPDIKSPIVINGTRPDRVTIRSNYPKRLFYINGDLTIHNATLADGYSDYGGAINVNSGSLTLDTVVFRNNVATQAGGAIHSGNGSDPSHPPTVTIINSLFYNNTASVQGGAINSSGSVVVSNSTFSGNTAPKGGAVYLDTNGSVNFISATLSGNSAIDGGSGIYAVAGSTLNIHNSILANSIAGNACGGSALAFIEYSLIDDGSCGTTNGVNGNLTGDPQLSALADNGGPTQTMALSSGSPAVDMGDNSLLTEAAVGADFNGDGDTNDTLTTDQRGGSYARVTNDTVDMGAFESPVPPSTLTVDTISDSNLTGCTDLPNDCSLRGAINDSNAYHGKQTILFDGTVFQTPQTITINVSLPEITSAIAINGVRPDLLTISGNHATRLFYINGDLAISNVTIADGYADYGGAIGLNSGSLTLDTVIMKNNLATQVGGAIHSGNGGAPSHSGTVTIINSLFYNNTASLQGGAINTAGSMVVSNSTFSGNTAPKGGAVYVDTYGSVNIISTTISGNGASGGGSGIYAAGGSFFIHNSILANSTEGSDCMAAVPHIVEYSLIEDGTCGITNGVNGNLTGDPLLDPAGLADNGGISMTIALLQGSPAINSGDNTLLNETALDLDLNGDGDKTDTLTTDQRGTIYTRVDGGTVDMGAMEYHAPAALPANAAPPINYFTSNTVTLTWSALSWATGYEVQLSTTSAFSTLLCGGTLQADASTLSVTTCQLTPGTYYWRVRGTSSSQASTTWSKPEPLVIGLR